MFLFWGVRDQRRLGEHVTRIIVDPQSKLVMVNTAVHGLPTDPVPLREMGALYLALVRDLGG